jgi:cytochrome oxidase Cu insertion factor (SCO1/SenC/PrrC family)
MSLLAALLLTIVAGTSAAPSRPAAVRATSPKIGQAPPTFTLRDQSGKRVSLTGAVGKKAVLVFYRGYW